MEYTDDMTKLTSDFNNARDAEANLGKNGLKINDRKTERFTIKSTAP